MRNNTMFGTLKNVLENTWFDNQNNRYVTFITENEEALYEVFSVYQIEAENYYMTTEFSNKSYTSFLNKLKQRSKFDFNVNVSNTDQILTLSTCANNNKYRVILHAKKVK